jgi:hypothetical protein
VFLDTKAAAAARRRRAAAAYEHLTRAVDPTGHVRKERMYGAFNELGFDDYLPVRVIVLLADSGAASSGGGGGGTQEHEVWGITGLEELLDRLGLDQDAKQEVRGRAHPPSMTWSCGCGGGMVPPAHVQPAAAAFHIPFFFCCPFLSPQVMLDAVDQMYDGALDRLALVERAAPPWRPSCPRGRTSCDPPRHRNRPRARARRRRHGRGVIASFCNSQALS